MREHLQVLFTEGIGRPDSLTIMRTGGDQIHFSLDIYERGDLARELREIADEIDPKNMGADDG